MRSSITVARAIDKLAHVRATLNALKRVAAENCGIIKKAGGGESRKWIATLVRVKKFEAIHSASLKVQLTRKRRASDAKVD